MGDPKGKLVTPVADNPDDELRSLEVDDNDNLKVAVETSALPTGASTSANQATIITALQLIDDLRNALGSVDTDDLQVDVKTAPTTTVIPHATEKLFGFESVINKTKEADADDASFKLATDAVPTGKIWKITHIAGWNGEGDIPTGYIIAVGDISVVNRFYRRVVSTAQNVTVNLDVELYLVADEYITFNYIGVTVGEACYLHIFGYEMNAP